MGQNKRGNSDSPGVVGRTSAGSDALDFDHIDAWEPSLTASLEVFLPKCTPARMMAAAPEFAEDARDLVVSLADRELIIDTALDWIRSKTVIGYHGTRLTDAEVASVRRAGLLPLRAEARQDRLSRALSPHPRWVTVAAGLGAAIRAHGEGAYAGRREGQVHLTLSRAGLVEGFNHYLTHGSEFDQHVAHALLGEEALELLRRDGEPQLIKVAVPGDLALAAAHPFFGIDDLRARGEFPNLVGEFLKAWSFRLARPRFRPWSFRVDCGMVFHSAIPSDWIVGIETPL